MLDFSAYSLHDYAQVHTQLLHCANEHKSHMIMIIMIILVKMFFYISLSLYLHTHGARMICNIQGI